MAIFTTMNDFYIPLTLYLVGLLMMGITLTLNQLRYKRLGYWEGRKKASRDFLIIMTGLLIMNLSRFWL